MGVALVFALLTGLFAANAFGTSTTYIQGICTTACYTIIMVTSLNLVVGFMGEFSLGHAGFVSVGAYVSAHCIRRAGRQRAFGSGAGS